MQPQTVSWPRKTREFEHHHFNSAVWNDFSFRDSDIIIATYAKSGTTWMQQIVLQLLSQGDGEVGVAGTSPWLDFRPLTPEVRQKVELADQRRVLKTHLPLDALVYSPRAKYLYICRDGRDVAWSLYNHYSHLKDEFYSLINDTPGWAGSPFPKCDVDVLEFYRRWVTEDGQPYWPFFSHVASWWAYRDLPNLMLVHFADLKRDLAGAIEKLAAFLDIDVAPAAMPRILEHCSFAYMKDNAERMAPRGGSAWEGGAETFINKGVNGRWRELLTADDVASFDAVAKQRLGSECARWLAEGGPL